MVVGTWVVFGRQVMDNAPGNVRKMDIEEIIEKSEDEGK